MPNVLITGCSSGFGQLAALAFARRGDRVFATVRRAGSGQALEDAAQAEGLDLSVHDLDVTDPQSVERAVTEITALADIRLTPDVGRVADPRGPSPGRAVGSTQLGGCMPHLWSAQLHAVHGRWSSSFALNRVAPVALPVRSLTWTI